MLVRASLIPDDLNPATPPQTLLLLSVLPSLTGICDESNFYLSVKYGSQGSNFQTWIGARHLTEEVSELYNFQENGTHFSLIVPYNAKDTVFEVCLSRTQTACME